MSKKRIGTHSPWTEVTNSLALDTSETIQTDEKSKLVLKKKKKKIRNTPSVKMSIVIVKREHFRF